jgi:hypothetical protein
VVARCSHQLYRCREGWRRAAWVGERGAMVLAPWGGKRAANPSDSDRGSGRVSGAEGVVIDRYVGRVVHGASLAAGLTQRLTGEAFG